MCQFLIRKSPDNDAFKSTQLKRLRFSPLQWIHWRGPALSNGAITDCCKRNLREASWGGWGEIWQNSKHKQKPETGSSSMNRGKKSHKTMLAKSNPTVVIESIHSELFEFVLFAANSIEAFGGEQKKRVTLCLHNFPSWPCYRRSFWANWLLQQQWLSAFFCFNEIKC